MLQLLIISLRLLLLVAIPVLVITFKLAVLVAVIAMLLKLMLLLIKCCPASLTVYYRHCMSILATMYFILLPSSAKHISKLQS